ncbi:hypothetical protein [Rhodoferax sediminis]|jgi:hypothetical protein|uniref:Uncharacterized protein n=1 Tax=Rhodoferax sediminis TaxID=2509614 RepID=A0A515D8W9_9BURK|nr:hypothetical protein [Rhodoferax sediminis]QDL36862.1 hypothetical protein EUB48_05805 [Rhodoferax sediminis]
MLSKALRAKYLGAERRLNRPARTIQNVAQSSWCIWYQAQQLGLRHTLQHQGTKTDGQRYHNQRRHEARRHEAVRDFCDAMQSEQAPARTLAQVQMIP